ncbi:hypothetical protein [Cytobacillus kochii]
MKKTSRLLLFLLLLFLSSCSTAPEPKISEQQAKSIVIEKNTRTIGNVTIVSIEQKGNNYIIKWENPENCESGVEHMNHQSGKIITSEVTIC